MTSMCTRRFHVLLATALAANPALALEYPVGAPKNVAGMEIAAYICSPTSTGSSRTSA